MVKGSLARSTAFPLLKGFIRAAAAQPPPCAWRLRLINAAQIIGVMREYAEKNVQLLCLPEFALTGYTCSDLFLQETLLRGAEDGLTAILKASEGLNLVVLVGCRYATTASSTTARQYSATVSCWALCQKCTCPTMANLREAPLHPRYA